MQTPEHHKELIKKAITLGRKIQGRGRKSAADVFKFLMLQKQSNLEDDKFAKITDIEPTKFYFWKNGKLASGDDWLELQDLINKEKALSEGKKLAEEMNLALAQPPADLTFNKTNAPNIMADKINNVGGMDDVNSTNTSGRITKKKNEPFRLENYPNWLITVNPGIYSVDSTKYLVDVQLRNTVRKFKKRFRKLTPSGLKKEEIHGWILPFVEKSLKNKKQKPNKTSKPKKPSKPNKVMNTQKAEVIPVPDSLSHKIIGIEKGSIIIEKLELQTLEISKNHPDYDMYVEKMYQSTT